MHNASVIIVQNHGLTLTRRALS